MSGRIGVAVLDCIPLQSDGRRKGYPYNMNHGFQLDVYAFDPEGNILTVSYDKNPCFKIPRAFCSGVLIYGERLQDLSRPDPEEVEAWHAEFVEVPERPAVPTMTI